MSALVVAALVPSLLDIHADARNADVLAARAGWRGARARVARIDTAADAEGCEPDVVTIGAGFDADAGEVLDVLRRIAEPLRRWSAQGVPLLAVGLGWELLSASVELVAGEPTEGIGLFAGRAVASRRRVGTIAADSEWGRLVGYEYHLRDWELGAGETPLARVVRGTGNLVAPGGQAHEGVVRGGLLGTNIRGPVLARNPRLADALLDRALARRAVPLSESAEDHAARRRADDFARRANEIVLADMRIGRDA